MNEARYRCKKCNSFIERGHRLQACQCGKVLVDFGAGGKAPWIRVLWPDGNPDDWFEVVEPPQG